MHTAFTHCVYPKWLWHVFTDTHTPHLPHGLPSTVTSNSLFNFWAVAQVHIYYANPHETPRSIFPIISWDCELKDIRVTTHCHSISQSSSGPLHFLNAKFTRAEKQNRDVTRGLTFTSTHGPCKPLRRGERRGFNPSVSPQLKVTLFVKRACLLARLKCVIDSAKLWKFVTAEWL